MKINYLILCLISCFISGCKYGLNQELFTEEIQEEIQNIEKPDCGSSDLGITEENLTLDNANWEVKYNETTVELSYSSNPFGHRRTYVFSKSNGCVDFFYGYNYFWDDTGGKHLSQIEYEVTLDLQEWIEDNKFVGQLTYISPNTNSDEVIIEKFWIKINEDNYFVDEPSYPSFSDCFGNQLPLNIDVNNDGNTNFIISSSIPIDPNYNPKYKTTYINIEPASSNDFILINDSTGFDFVFSSSVNYSISSEGKKLDTNLKSFALFNDYIIPYKRYNHWADTAGYDYVFSGQVDLINDYLIIAVSDGTDLYYGWIRFTMDRINCNVEIHEIYLHDIANEHISII